MTSNQAELVLLELDEATMRRIDRLHADLRARGALVVDATLPLRDVVARIAQRLGRPGG